MENNQSIIAPWMKIAEQELGTAEDPTNKSNPKILRYAASLKYPMRDDSSDKWCAMFAAYCLEQSGFMHSKSAAAISYMPFGIECEPIYGAIAVFEWSSGFHHVAFVDGVEGELLRCLGGNQGPDKVCYKVFDKKYLIACRWPTKLLPQDPTK